MPLKLVKVKKSENWYIRGTVLGKSVYETTGTPDKRLAEACRINLEREIQQAHIYGVKSIATFGDAVISYLEAGGSGQYLNKLVEQWENRPLKDITQSDLDAIARKIHPNCKPQTLNRQIYTPFVAVWNHAASGENPMCDFRKWRRPKINRADFQRKQWFRVGQAAKFYAELPPHLKPLFTFVILTGTRITEAIELEWQDIDLENSWATIKSTKTGHERGVPLHGAVIDELSRIDGRKGRVFITHKGKPYAARRHESGRLKRSDYFKTAWAATRRRSGIEGVTPYSMRHTFATWCAMSGITEDVRESIMGHTRKSINAMYVDMPDSHLIELVNKLPDFR